MITTDELLERVANLERRLEEAERKIAALENAAKFDRHTRTEAIGRPYEPVGFRQR